MTSSRSRQRSQIAIPAQGMIELRDMLTDLLAEFLTDDYEEGRYTTRRISLSLIWTTFSFSSCKVSQTIPRSQQRSQIAIPAQGMIEFRDALTDLLDEFGTDDHGMSSGAPCLFVNNGESPPSGNYTTDGWHIGTTDAYTRGKWRSLRTFLFKSA